jgi:PAS domain S-box-containing protein
MSTQLVPPAPASAHDKPLPHWALALLLTWAAYLLAGLLALKLAIPPGYASPLYPSAGIALAAVLVYGWRVVPGVVLGAFCVNLTLSAQRGNLDYSALGLPACIALGAGLQAWAGAALVRRFALHPDSVGEPRDIAVLFGLGALAACTIGASIATLGLAVAGTVPATDLPVTWFTWWVGDALGALIAAPVMLTLIGRPRAEWAPRRLTVGLTLALLTMMMALAIAQVARWDDERVNNAFERDASNLTAAIAAQMQEPLRALEALRGIFIASDEVDRDEMRRATAAWLASGTLQAMGWHERVPRTELAAFEARVRAKGLPQYRVFDRNDEATAAPASGDEVFAMRYVEPMQGNAAALGVNALSIPAARQAIEATIRTDLPAATAGFRLTQQTGNGDAATGVVIYQAIFRGNPSTAQERKAAVLGIVFVTLRLDALLGSLTGQYPRYLGVCIVDTDALSPRRRLAGSSACESDAAGMLHVRPIAFAGRQWDLRTFASRADVPEARITNAWLFSGVGLLGAAMLGALLLTVTGRTRRIEAAVRERTAALEAEVHERESAQAALRDSEQRFRNILNTVPIGVIYTDLRGNVKQTNPRFCELTGYSDEELLAMTSAQYTHPDDVAEDVELSGRLVRGDLPMYRRHKRYVTKDGRTVWVQSTVTLLRDELGTARRIVGVVEDITEHLRLQDAEKARDLAEAANRAKSEFLSRMSHELRTPLNAMLGFAQLLELDRRQPLSADQRPWVSQIQQAGWHLLEMINDVLDLSRIESGNLKLRVEPISLPDLLGATVSMVDADAQRRSIRISTELADGTGALLGDSTRVKQILTNLLSNAVKYNTEAGRIHVATRQREPNLVEIAVTDTGMGMTPQQMAELFQPFNRLGRERSSQEGTGIGLVISQRLAELMGGSLRARSIAGEGSSFILALPRALEPDTVPSDLDALPTPDPAYHRRMVHYVEDNETNVEVMRGILAQRPQVQLEVSINGLDGLAAIRKRQPDLVLLDMHLPDISGQSLLVQLKDDDATAHIPVVVVSADATVEQIEAALTAGAKRYLTKPVSVAELLATVDEELERSTTRFG